MFNKACQATTKVGKQCSREAGPSGYCHIHDPEKIVQRQITRKQAEETYQQAWTKGIELREILEIVEKTCQAKGWYAHTSNCDYENWRYATVTVERDVRTQLFPEKVVGVLDISMSGGVRIACNNTSFHSYGLKDLHASIMNEVGQLPWLTPDKKSAQDQSSQPKPSTALQQLENLIKRFHIAARQLSLRHDNRSTLSINDEYDVQDFLHILLKATFDDVRPEEPTPSRAGASAQTDFLLKNEQIVVEAKMTNNKLKDKQVGEQLIIDIERYQSHQDCKTLVCIVYDPTHRINNPTGLEKDLSRKHSSLEVRVFIVPH